MNEDIIINSSEESIKSHLHNYYSALKTNQEISISTLIDSYKNMEPAMHEKLFSPSIDTKSLDYTLNRLPECIFQVKKVLLAQNQKDLEAKGFTVKIIDEVTAKRRRRRCYFNQATNTLAYIITSDSDIDDLINALISYQIEWFKISELLKGRQEKFVIEEDFNWLRISEDSWQKLKKNSGVNWNQKILSTKNPTDISVKLVKREDLAYHQASKDWLHEILTKPLVMDLPSVPIYFVSSNLHGLINVAGGVVRHKQNEIFGYVLDKYDDLNTEWENIKNGGNVMRVNDFLYYISQIYFEDHPQEFQEKTQYESQLGIKKIKIDSELTCDAQLIPVSAITRINNIEPYLSIKNPQKIEESDAYILNIDYPLGFSAYYIIQEILNNLKNLKGVYIMGKAAILSGNVGDIQVPRIIFDERTNNIYQIQNIFNQISFEESARNVVLKEQKAVSVHGTFLENQKQIDNYIATGYNVIEMESGPYLTGITQILLNNGQVPGNNVYNVSNLPFDFGIINYASDNPLTQSLGEGSLALKGIEPTYLSIITILQRIIDLEILRT